MRLLVSQTPIWFMFLTTNHANTPFTRYLQGLLRENNIQYMNEKEYYDANQSIR